MNVMFVMSEDLRSFFNEENDWLKLNNLQDENYQPFTYNLNFSIRDNENVFMGYADILMNVNSDDIRNYLLYSKGVVSTDCIRDVIDKTIAKYIESKDAWNEGNPL